MAATVSWDGLRELAAFRAAHGCAVSVYVDLDPSISPTAAEAHTRLNSLLERGARILAEAETLTHAQKQALRADLDAVRRYFEEDFDRDGAHGLAVFAARLDNVWTPLPLTDAVPDEIKVGRQFYVAPLVPLVGRGDGALVAVVGRERGHVYRLQAGRLRELADRTQEQPFSRHDQGGWSQARYQRHVDELGRQHLRDVADELDRQVRRLRVPRVVVVASEEARAEFDGLVSNAVQEAIVGSTQAEAHAGPAELMDVVRPVLERWRARQEEEAVERWREEAGRNGRATSGWAGTLEAASDGRVEALLYQEGAEHEAWHCPKCGRAAAAPGSCPLDGTRMEAEPNGLDLAVHQALAHGGRVVALQHRHDLEPVEGIAALLRY